MYETPYRIEFFGDEVDSIRDFDIESQKSLNKFEAFTIYPCREIVIDAIQIDAAILKLKLLKSKYKLQKREKIEEMIEHLNERIFVDGIDRYFPLFYEKSETLLDYFDDPIVFLMGNNQCVQRIIQYYEEYKRQFADYLERGEVISEQFERIFDFEAIKAELSIHQVVLSELLMKHTDGFAPNQIIKLSSREMSKYYGKFDQIALDIRKWKLKGYHVLVAFSSSERLTRFLSTMEGFELAINSEVGFERVMSGQAIAIYHPIQSGFYFDTFKAVDRKSVV